MWNGDEDLAMLVHVFTTLVLEEEVGTSFFPQFLKRAAKASKILSMQRDGEYFVVEGVRRKTKKRFKVEWSSGMLYQKLRTVHSKRSLPVLWRLCRYYYGGDDDIVSGVLRQYLSDHFGEVIEPVPFCLEKNGSLSTTLCRKKPGSTLLHKELAFSGVKIVVDKQSTRVILLPHREVARTLLLLLKEFL